MGNGGLLKGFTLVVVLLAGIGYSAEADGNIPEAIKTDSQPELDTDAAPGSDSSFGGMENVAPVSDTVSQGLPTDSVVSAPSDSLSTKSVNVDSVDKQQKYYELREKIIREPSSAVHRHKRISKMELDRAAIHAVPATQGDPMRALATLPGVTTANDASVKPMIRGGKAEETRVFWDNVPLMQPYHILSIYSLFNTESIDKMTLYSGGFPVEGRNALSGALFVDSRPAPLDSFQLYADLSMLRAHFYTGVPIVKNKFGVYASYQSFYYDFVFNRLWDLVVLLSKNDAVKEERDEFQKYVDLPNFRDFQFGANADLGYGLKANYVGLISNDVFTNMYPKKQFFVNKKEIPPTFYERHLYFSGEPASTRKIREIPDTLAIVRVENDIHNANLNWVLTDKWTLRSDLALQRQKWHVHFYDEEEWTDHSISPDEFIGYKEYKESLLKFELDRDLWSLNVLSVYETGKFHTLTGGFSYDYLEETFNTDLMRIFFEMIVNGNTNMMNSLGHYNPEGFTVTNSDSGADEDIDYLTQLMEQIEFKHRGKTWAGYYGFYIKDEWRIGSGMRLESGVRLEYEENSEEMFVSPRISYFHNLDNKNEISVSTGLYSQSDAPFYMRQVNPGLSAEKSFHFNGEWTHHFSKHYRFEWQNYYKYYFHLLTPRLVNTGRLDWSNGNIAGLDSAEFADVSEGFKREFIRLYGQHEYQYSNHGIGYSLGSEVSFIYDPAPYWKGWFSAEATLSRRRDFEGENWYNFQFHRPWAVNWVNQFIFPGGKYDLSFRTKWAAGLPYTGFNMPGITDNTESDTLIAVGPKNGRRYQPYTRTDLRLTKHSKLWKHPFETYLGIWNFYNKPNFLLRDSKTGSLKFWDPNFPFPIIFLGANFRW